MPDVPNLEPPSVSAADEGRHEPGPAPLWNESWYFDVADPVGEIGAYVRFGLYPNRSQTWFQLNVVGRGRTLVALRDETAPLVEGDDLRITTRSWSAALEAEVPLERWRVTASGTAQLHPDPTAVYRQEPGDPVDVEVDLTWQTVGAPYHYGVATRYEVSSQVTGTIRVGDDVSEVDAPGQRDHSWGVRDWWAFGWCWSAGALDDGTRFHLSDIRFPQGSAGFGYVLDPSGHLTPATSITATEVVDTDGFPTSARLTIEPGGLAVDLEPVAFSPLLFTADDGRVSRFPRALCRYRTADGRVGAGWTEWNQLQDQPG